MKKAITLFFAAKMCFLTVFSQDYRQYFDGADTNKYHAIIIEKDTAAANIWQIGRPQKFIFDSAATMPNVIITDTINPYPPNNISSFVIRMTNEYGSWWGIRALQWKQKLDLDSAADGALIELSTDGGTKWENVFNNPYVYNFVGYDTANVDTLPDGRFVFTGTDTGWKDIWLCFEYSWLSTIGDTARIRFTIISDSIDNEREGWMIDNMLAHRTVFHTINELKQEKYIEVSPNPTTGRVNISTRKTNGFHIIEEMKLMDGSGKVVKEYGTGPVKYFIDISDQPDGLYYLKIKTNLQTETLRILLQR